MLKKLGNLLNLKAWVENFLLKTLLNKGVKHAVTVVIGLIMGAKIQAILTTFGVDIDVTKLQTELTVLFGGLAGSFINWAIKVMDKDGDGKIG